MRKSLWFKVFSTVMGLTMLASFSSFFLADYISYIIENDRNNAVELSIAKQLELPAYYHYQRRHQEYASLPWLAATTILAKHEERYSIELAQYYTSIQRLEKSEYWYLKAVQQQSEHARLVLAQRYFAEKKYQAVQNLLSKKFSPSEPELAKQAQSLLMEIALIEGDFAKIQKAFQHLKKLAPAHPFLEEVIKYQAITDQLSFIDPIASAPDCLADIQMFATNLADLRKVDQLIKQIQTHALAEYVCFAPVRYIALKALNCKHHGNETIQCDEGVWRKYQASIKSRFLGVLIPQGGANVNNGIMYLDRQDTVEVFAHELAHFIGFIDEYPLPSNHTKCLTVQSKPFSQNIAVLPALYQGDKQQIRAKILKNLPWKSLIKTTTPILTSSTEGWKLGTPQSHQADVGVFLSETCEGKRKLRDALHQPFNAYKPLKKHNQLSYFSLAFPESYRKLITINAEKYLMPSFHINIENALRND